MLKIPDTPCQEAAPTLAGEPCRSPAPSPAPSLPPAPLRQRWAALPCRLHRSDPESSRLPGYGRPPCDSRHLVFKSIKPNFCVVFSLHGFQALGQDNAKGVGPGGKPSPLFPKPQRRPSHQRLSRLSPAINPLCLGTRGH